MESIYTISNKWVGRSFHRTAGTVPLWRHESVQRLTASLWHSCAAIHLRPWEEPQINFPIMIQFTSLSMILCLCWTNGSTRLSTLTVQHPSPHPAPPTKRGIPRMCPAVPPMSPILPSSSNIHCLSLTLKDHYCQCYDWTHSDGCMAPLFQRVFFIYIYCIAPYSSSHHRSVWKRVPWNSCHFSSSCWGIIKSAALGLRTELVAHALQFWFASLKRLDRSDVLKVKNIVKQVLQSLPIWQFYCSQSEPWYPGKHHHATRQRLLIIYLFMSVYCSLFS